MGKQQRSGLFSVVDYNHFTVFVKSQARSIRFYRGAFRLPIDTYQGSMPILRVGRGNQFLALVSAGGRPAFEPRIHHLCWTVKGFHPEKMVRLLTASGISRRAASRGPLKPLQSFVTMRMPDRGGAPEGTPELYFTDPDGILLQLQDTRYCGGRGYLGDQRGTPKSVDR